MTEEKYKEIKSLKDEIEKLENRLFTINKLIESARLQMEIKGTSTCNFRINRFLTLYEDDFIKSILDGERKTTEYNLSALKRKFEGV